MEKHQHQTSDDRRYEITLDQRLCSSTDSSSTLDETVQTVNRLPEQPRPSLHQRNDNTEEEVEHCEEDKAVPDFDPQEEHAVASTEDETMQTEEHYYPEGGYGWVVLASTFLAGFWTQGTVFGWGIYQDYFIHNNIFPGADAKNLSWVGSISCASMFFAAPGVVAIMNKVGIKPLLVFGVVLAAGGYLGSSFATQYWHLYITLAFLNGIGGCLCYFTSLTVLAQYFNKKRALVVGIAMSGSGIGASSMAPVLRTLLSEVGFRWTLRIMAGCLFVCLGLVAAFVRPYIPEPSTLADHAQQSVKTLGDGKSQFCDNDSTGREKATSKSRSMSNGGLDWTLLRDSHYRLVLLATTIFSIVYLVPFLLAPSYARSIGLTPTQGAIMVTVCAATGFIFRMVMGHVADRYGVLNSTMVCGMLSGISCLALWLPAKSYPSMAAFMFSFGLFAGPSIMLYPVAATRVLHPDRVSSALGFIFFAHAIGYLVGSPLSQFIVAKQDGSYNGAIIFLGAMNILCGSIIVYVRFSKDRRIWVAL